MPPPSGPPPVLSKLLHKRNSIKYRDCDEDTQELKPLASSPEATGTIDHPLMPGLDDLEMDSIPGFQETSQDDTRSLGSIDSTSEGQEFESNAILLTPDDSGIYWQTEISLMKNQTEQIHVGLVSHGKYVLNIEKCDALSRVLSVQLVLSRGGVMIKKERFYVGGMKAFGKCFNYHFTLKQNTRVDISFKSKAITNISPLKVIVVLKHEDEKDDRAAPGGKSTPPVPALLKNPPFRKTGWHEDDASQEDSSEDIAIELSPRSLSSKQGDSSIKVLQKLENVSFTKPFTVTQKLEAGYYYFGVRNDSGKQIAPDLRKMVASMQILRHDGVIIQEETYPEFLKVNDLPWKKNFSISPPQAPATLTITLKPTSVPAVTASIKITTAPDPNSFDEIMKRTKDLRMKIAAVVAALLFLSYGWQIVSFIFALEIPLVKISVRFILTVVVGVYGYQNRHEILEIIRHKSQTTQQKLSFFKELDQKDSGLEKIKMLSEEGKRKREVRKLLKEAQMGL